MTHPLRVAGLAGVLALAALTGCGSGGGSDSSASATSTDAAPQSAAEGKPAPSWSEKTSTGETLASASLKGKPVYLNFFATWCPPCNEEAPDVNALQEKYKASGLKVVGVDVAENAEKAEKFRKQHNLSYTAVVDSGSLRDAYNINGLPVHVFIARDGVVKKIVIGEMNKSEIEQAIKTII